MLALASRVPKNQYIKVVSRLMSSNALKIPLLPRMSHQSKLVLSVSGYLLAAGGVAAVVDRKNLGHVFKQLGDW